MCHLFIITAISINQNVLIGLTQHTTRCSDCSGQSKKDLIAGHASVEVEAELIQAGLQFCASTMISAQQEGFQITDCLVQPVNISSLVLLRLHLCPIEIQVAAITVTFTPSSCLKILVNYLLYGLPFDVLNHFHSCKKSCTIFREVGYGSGKIWPSDSRNIGSVALH